MTLAIATQNAGNQLIDHTPNLCAVCRHAIEPKQLIASVTNPTSEDGQLQVCYRCQRRECGHLFFAYYRKAGGGWVLDATGPFTPLPPSVPVEVASVSPGFVRIYTQAAAAEGYGLDEIAGVGYRKALEFLVKDFSILLNPTDTETIKAMALGAVIKTHIPDANIKECARRATWLGNDETHYVRKWTAKDIGDLKALIDLTVSWIKTDRLTQKYLTEMPDST